MQNILFVGLGGFVGAVLRYLLGSWIQSASGNNNFPYGTLVVNLTGCLLIGIFLRLVATSGLVSEEVRLFAMVGLLGAFTTFSTFSGETLLLLREGKVFFSVLNIGLQVGFGLFFVWAGHFMAASIAS